MKRFSISGATKHARKAFKHLVRFYGEHKHEVMAAVGICGYLESMYLVYKNAEDIKEGIAEKDAKKIIKSAGPAVVTATMSTIAVVGSVRTSNKRYTTISAAYALTDAAYSEYRESAKEYFGEKKEEKIDRTSIDNELQRIPPKDDLIINTGHGTTLCYERLTGRYFYSDINFIKACVNEVNEMFDNGEDTVRLDDLYCQLDLDSTAIGREMGWQVEYGRARVDYSSHLTPDGTPCLAISYRNLGMIEAAFNGTFAFIPVQL